jgi:transposase-like protein
MRVISQSPDPLARMHTMTKRQGKSGTIDVKALLAEDEEFLRALVRTALQEVLEAEMTEALSAEKGVSSQEGAEAAITPVNKRDNHSNS